MNTKIIYVIACIHTSLLMALPTVYLDSSYYDEEGYDNSTRDTNGETYVMEHCINNGSIVFDIGAHAGGWIQRLLQLKSPKHIFAIEPLPDAFNVLRTATYATQTMCYNIAISEQTGMRTFYYYNTDPLLAELSGFFERAHVRDHVGVRPFPIRVVATSLSHFCEIHSISHINFLNISASGAELEVLHGSAALFAENKVDAILFEYGGTYKDANSTLHDAYTLLVNNGFSIFRVLPDALLYVAEWRPELETYRCSHYLALHQACPLYTEIMASTHQRSDSQKEEISVRRSIGTIPVIENHENALNILIDTGIWQPGKTLRLHLGCGEVRLSGYVNIDFPPQNHTIQTKCAVDVYGDITSFHFPPASVDEIRSHHIFEHFPRSQALALIAAWVTWLKPGGILIIETPDALACMEQLTSSTYGYTDKQIILRHLFGSHEAPWAIHCDGWYKEKFEHILPKFGFTINNIKTSEYKLLRNITVTAVKNATLSSAELDDAIAGILSECMVDKTSSEQRMHSCWVDQYKTAVSRMTAA